MKKGHKLHCEAWRSENWWIAQCLEVAVVVQGETLASAKRNLENALATYFEDVAHLEKSGEKVSLIPRVPWYYARLVRWHLRSLVALRAKKLARQQEQHRSAFELEPSLVYA